jgi:hypothetical protein
MFKLHLGLHPLIIRHGFRVGTGQQLTNKGMEHKSGV